MKTIWFFICLNVFFLFFIVSGESDPSPRVLLVIPGVGNVKRLKNVNRNIKYLKEKTNKFSSIQFDCVIYTYATENHTSFWEGISRSKNMQKICTIIKNPNKRFAEHLYLLQPSQLENKYDWIFLLLDDCNIYYNESFDLISTLKYMMMNNLTLSSPRIENANKVGGNKFRLVMQKPAPEGYVGVISSFIELFAWVMTPEAYKILWELLCPEINPYGWGYDFWYDGYASVHLHGHKMGIISSMAVLHDQDNSAFNGGREDNEAFDVKWKAVLKQEQFYRKHKNINLKKFRLHMNLKSKDWDGAIQGLIKPLP